MREIETMRIHAPAVSALAMPLLVMAIAVASPKALAAECIDTGDLDAGIVVTENKPFMSNVWIQKRTAPDTILRAHYYEGDLAPLYVSREYRGYLIVANGRNGGAMGNSFSYSPDVANLMPDEGAKDFVFNGVGSPSKRSIAVEEAGTVAIGGCEYDALALSRKAISTGVDGDFFTDVTPLLYLPQLEFTMRGNLETADKLTIRRWNADDYPIDDMTDE